MTKLELICVKYYITEFMTSEMIENGVFSQSHINKVTQAFNKLIDEDSKQVTYTTVQGR